MKQKTFFIVFKGLPFGKKKWKIDKNIGYELSECQPKSSSEGLRIIKWNTTQVPFYIK